MNDRRILPMLQPANNLCGQTVVAMVVGRNVEDITILTGKRKTFPQDLRRAFAEFGWTMAERSLCKYPIVPVGELAAFFGQTVRSHKLYGHWMLWTGNAFFDPSSGCRVETLAGNWSGRFYSISEPTNGATT